MNPNDNLKKFKEAVSVGISWDKKSKKMNASFQNNSDLDFYLIQGEILYFNKNRRMIGGMGVIYKYLLANSVLFDDFIDADTRLTDNIVTVVFKPSSVELENPFVSTSVEERLIEVQLNDEDKKVKRIKRIFDTDFLTLPESSD